jgi:hypothetical protein
MSGVHPIEKIMSLTREDFLASLRHAGPADDLGGDVHAVALNTGRAIIRFQKLPGARLGGLLDLPRAKVTIAFEDVAESDRTAFLKRFDMAFQRGGG